MRHSLSPRPILCGIRRWFPCLRLLLGGLHCHGYQWTMHALVWLPSLRSRACICSMSSTINCCIRPHHSVIARRSRPSRTTSHGPWRTPSPHPTRCRRDGDSSSASAERCHHGVMLPSRPTTLGPMLAVAKFGEEPLPMVRRGCADVVEDRAGSPAAPARSLPPPCLCSLLEKLSSCGVIYSLCMTQNQE